MADVRDVAERADVSIATVSRVLNGTANVSQDRRERVLRSAEELGYSASFAARSLRTSRTNVIGLVLPPLANPYFSTVIASVSTHARESGYQVLISSSTNMMADIATLTRAQMVDGLIILAASTNSRVQQGTTPTTDAPQWGIPVVAIDRAPLDPRVPLITADHEGGARQATEHLVGLGHQRIGYIGGPTELGVSRLRASGFREALAKADRTVVESLVRQGDFSEASGYLHATQFVRYANPLPTAMFCANDMMAIGAMRALRDNGLNVPTDVSIIGFDGLPISQYVMPALTTIKQPVEEMGRDGLNLLLRQIDGEPQLTGAVDVLPTSLCLRESTDVPAR